MIGRRLIQIGSPGFSPNWHLLRESVGSFSETLSLSSFVTPRNPASSSGKHRYLKGMRATLDGLDCVLQFGREAVIVIEVKLTNADATDTAKQVGYSRWLNDQQVCFKKALLLATGGKGEDYYTFTLLRWKDVCQRLRRLLPELCCEHEIITAALIAGFIGAVEQNLLGVPSLSWIDKYRNDRRSAALQFIDRIDAATEYVQGTLA
jgi:hypothetical protein